MRDSRLQIRSVKVVVPDGPFGDITATADMPTAVNSEHPALPWALLAHCFTCDRNARGIAHISKALARSGFGCLRIDFSNLVLGHNVMELCHVAKWMARRGNAPQLLVGHSLGGNAAIRAAASIASTSVVSTVGTPYDPRHVAATLPDVVQRFSDDAALDHIETCLAGRPIQLPRELLTDLSSCDPQSDLRALSEANIPLLVIHSPFDQTVPFSDAQRILSAGSQPTSLLSLPEVDHLLTRRGSGQRVGELIASWARPYVSDQLATNNHQEDNRR